MIIVAAIVIPVVVIGVAAALLIKPASAQPIDGIECNVNEFNNYHVHAHLDVFIDGKQQQVPARAGIMSTPSCFYWLHTHTTDGIIHIEAPTTRSFTLGQFLDIWHQTGVGGQAFFDSVSSKPVTAYVNGTQFQGEYKNIQLESREQIVLAYGNPPATIPTHDFGNLR